MLIDSKRIAKLLSEARKRAGATQEETAELLFVSARTVQRWETGEKQPTLEEFISWYRTLGLNWFRDVLRLAYPELYSTTLMAAPPMWNSAATACLNIWPTARRAK